MPADSDTIRSCPYVLLLGVYVLYLGLTTSASVPIFGDIDWLHEGERLGSVQVVLDGGLPFRDVYLPHGLFPEVIRPLIAFSIFGESLAADRLMGLLLAPLPYVAAVFYVWRLFPVRFWRIAGLAGMALYPLLLVPRHAVVFLALGLVTAWTRERHCTQLIGAGIITGLGFIFSTIDHALFLLASVALFPLVMMAERYAVTRSKAADHALPSALGETIRGVAAPLFTGTAMGLLPFVGYLAFTGTTGTFIRDLFRRSEADAHAFTHVWGHQSLPPLSLANALWYVVPLCYVGLTVMIAIRMMRRSDRSWIPFLPTLLFGIFSFIYAVRQFNFGKLALVSFPFIVGVIYLLYVTTAEWKETTASLPRRPSRMTVWVLLGLTGVLMTVLLVQSFSKDWKPKQVAPRVLFPALAVLILTAAGMTAAGRIRTPAGRQAVLVACPLAALIVSAWFYNDAKPQVLSAQLKKPKLVSDAGRLVGVMAAGPWRFSREHPRYLEDDMLSYLKVKAHEGQEVVVLAVGAGIYYFHAGAAPPLRFPGIEIAMADGWAREVVEVLERTRAELLVSCRDQGRTITGWPVNPILADFISSNYVDSGFLLQSTMLGDACPFSVWRRRDAGERAEMRGSSDSTSLSFDGKRGGS